jgi:hypothetical protein
MGPKLSTTADRPPVRPVAPDGARRTAGFVAGGGGVVLLGVGTFFGIRALGFKSDRDRDCEPSGCSQAGLDAHADARTNAWISTVTMGAGAVGLGLGAFLLLTSTSRGDVSPGGRASRPDLRATAGPGGIVLRGRM